jgi:hypothetical protein
MANLLVGISLGRSCRTLNVSLTLAVKWFPDGQIECDQTALVGSIDTAMPPPQENALMPLAPEL